MRPNPPSTLSPPPGARIELVLRLDDGSAWTVSVSAGMERFIGHYPRLPGFASDGPLLAYRRAFPAS